VESFDREWATGPVIVRQAIVEDRNSGGRQPRGVLNPQINCVAVGVAQHEDFLDLRQCSLDNFFEPPKSAPI
jgi:hypothetical protein